MPIFGLSIMAQTVAQQSCRTIAHVSLQDTRIIVIIVGKECNSMITVKQVHGQDSCHQHGNPLVPIAICVVSRYPCRSHHCHGCAAGLPLHLRGWQASTWIPKACANRSTVTPGCHSATILTSHGFRYCFHSYRYYDTDSTHLIPAMCIIAMVPGLIGVRTSVTGMESGVTAVRRFSTCESIAAVMDSIGRRFSRHDAASTSRGTLCCSMMRALQK